MKPSLPFTVQFVLAGLIGAVLMMQFPAATGEAPPTALFWSAAAVKAEKQSIGLDGSPTKVVKIFAPPTKTGGLKVDGREDPASAIQAIMKALNQKGVA